MNDKNHDSAETLQTMRLADLIATLKKASKDHRRAFSRAVAWQSGPQAVDDATTLVVMKPDNPYSAAIDKAFRIRCDCLKELVRRGMDQKAAEMLYHS